MKIKNDILISVDDEDINDDGTFIIPDGIKSIHIGAFAGCINLITVNIPDSVKYIQIHAFTQCFHLDKNIIDNLIDRYGVDII